MDKLLENLIENSDRMINEMDIKKGLRTAAATALIGGAALGLGKLTSMPPEQSVKAYANTGTSVQLNKGAEKSVGVEASLKKFFPEEYDTIKKAADRNNCTGEDLVILFAIRKVENGPKGTEFGILHPRAVNTDLNTQAGWAAATIVKNRQRWNKKGDFISFLGSKYCPVGAKNDPTCLNKNWVPNMKHWVRKLSK